ncbi:hypothetical protein ALC62_02474 [Cyphomyrmex costatus]|uniref:CCHC-type domain-containing protein n=2 Tax=Cyphomyrmex costatus TaxID=456900 RepID=A0A151INC4_9HYME|nr:hypothetical protein ALC62_02474 [Cyphomyrmex costatus]
MYSELMRRARENISLEDMDIRDTKITKTLKGSLAVQVYAAEARQKAKGLAEKIRELYRGNEKVKVYSPSPTGELIIWDLDETIEEEEVRQTVIKLTGMETEDIKIGSKRVMRNGMFSLWVRCPLEEAVKLSENGKIRIGWSSLRIQLLKKRPIKYFRCMARGHTRESCPSKIDRSGCCYNCGRQGHRAETCRSRAVCPVCVERGVEAGHRAGDAVCPPVYGRPVLGRIPRQGEGQKGE